MVNPDDLGALPHRAVLVRHRVVLVKRVRLHDVRAVRTTASLPRVAGLTVTPRVIVVVSVGACAVKQTRRLPHAGTP